MGELPNGKMLLRLTVNFGCMFWVDGYNLFQHLLLDMEILLWVWSLVWIVVELNSEPLAEDQFILVFTFVVVTTSPVLLGGGCPL